MYLILKFQLATRHYSVQNKAAINPPWKATINSHEEFLVNTGLSEFEPLKADIGESQKAAIPHKDNIIFIYYCNSKNFDCFILRRNPICMERFLASKSGQFITQKNLQYINSENSKEMF